MKYTPADIAKLGTILGIWAHPDDEAWTMAGVIAAAKQNGQQVVIITATRGEAGKTADETRWPQKQLAAIRTKELEKALRIMGVSHHFWLDLKDGHLTKADPTDKIAQIIDRVKPDTIFSFAQDGITGHPDHKAVCRWAIKAAQKSGSSPNLFGAIESSEKYKVVCQDCPDICKNVYFNTTEPATMPMAKVDLCFSLTPTLQAIKRRALECQPSQTSQLFSHPEGQAFIDEQVACECFVNLPA